MIFRHVHVHKPSNSLGRSNICRYQELDIGEANALKLIFTFTACLVFRVNFTFVKPASRVELYLHRLDFRTHAWFKMDIPLR